MTIKNAALTKKGKMCKTEMLKPRRLSKLGEWMRANPNGLEGRILDMRAAMR